MRAIWAAGTAIVVALVLGGTVATGQDASPVGATGDVQYAIFIPPEAIPVGLVKIPVDQWTVATGVDVETAPYNEAIRGRGCLVRSGTLVVRPVADALLWRAADAIGGPSTVTPGGVPVTLVSGDVLLLPALPEEQVDPATGVGLVNPGPDQAMVFCFHLHQPGGVFSGWPDGIESTVGVTYSDGLDMQATEAGGAEFRLTRYTLPADGSISLPSDAAYAIYTVDEGHIRSSAGGAPYGLGGGTVLSARTEPPLRIEVTGGEPAVVLELAVIPAAGVSLASPR